MCARYRDESQCWASVISRPSGGTSLKTDMNLWGKLPAIIVSSTNAGASPAMCRQSHKWTRNTAVLTWTEEKWKTSAARRIENVNFVLECKDATSSGIKRRGPFCLSALRGLVSVYTWVLKGKGKIWSSHTASITTAWRHNSKVQVLNLPTSIPKLPSAENIWRIVKRKAWQRRTRTAVSFPNISAAGLSAQKFTEWFYCAQDMHNMHSVFIYLLYTVFQLFGNWICKCVILLCHTRIFQ